MHLHQVFTVLHVHVIEWTYIKHLLHVMGLHLELQLQVYVIEANLHLALQLHVIEMNFDQILQ